MNQLAQLIKKTFVLLAFFVFSNSFGQNKDIGVFTSADIGYKCLGGDEYEVTLKVYVECGYDNGVLENSDNFPITVESKSLNTKFEPKVLKPENSADRNGEKIYIFCPEQGSKCDGKTNRGLKLYKYSAIIDLSLYEKASDWKIFWARNNKSAEILTIEARQPYHTEVTINNLTTCNSTPTTDLVPVFGIKKGEADTVQLAGVDPDGNQLRYSIVSPLQGLNTPINYKGGISATQPFGEGKSVTINNSGQLILPAVDQAGVNANFDVLIEEFNGNTKVGESRKGFQVVTLETDNTAPVMSGINGTNNTSITICAGERLTMMLTGSDPDGNKMRFLGNPQISPQKFIPFSRNTIDANPNFKYTATPTGAFNWQTTALDTGTYKVVVTLEDDACPVNLTTTKEFTIRVNPIPTFDLGSSQPFNCGDPQVFDPEIFNAVGNLSYTWGNWYYNPFTNDTINIPIQTEKRLEVEGPDDFYLEVSDDAGCSKTDRITVFESLIGSMNFYGRCIGQTTTFEDLSSFRESEFVSRKWTIETKPGTTDLEEFEHKFPGVGSYDAQLIVEDDLGCIDTIERVVRVVEEPEAALNLVDSCSVFLKGTYDRGGVDFYDISTYQPGDNRDSITWTVSTITGDKIATLIPPQNPRDVLVRDRWLDFGFPDSGMYVIKTEINTSASCQASKVDTIHIVQRPQLVLISDSVYSYNCANPAPVFEVTLDDYYTGTSGYDFWYFNPDSVKSPITSFTDPKTILPIDTDSLGTYTYWVKDSKGCEHFQTVEVVFSTDAGLGYELQCSQGEIQFRDLSTIDTTDRTIVDWNWDFGDGNSSKLQEPSHLYNTQGVHPVVLTITDSKGCINTDSLDVYYSFPISNLRVLAPNLDTIQLCAENIINLENDLSIQPNSQYNINTLTWRFIYANGDTVPENYPVVDFNGDRRWITQTHQLRDTTSNLLIEHEFTFNGNPNNVTAGGQVCSSLEQLSKPLKIFPRFNGEVLRNRVCIGDSGIFKFLRATETDSIKFRSAEWIFKNASTRKIIASTNDFEPSLFIDNQDFTSVSQDIRVVYNLEDQNRCVLRDSVDFPVQEVTAKPSWDFDNVVCKGEKILFTLKADQGDVDYWQINKNYEDSLVAGNFVAPKFDGDVIGSPVLVFDKAESIPISLFLIKITSIQAGRICRARIDDTIRVNDVPSYNIEWDTVCSAVSPTTFINNSTINGDFGKVIDYRWDFGDGSEQVITPAGQVEVKHRFAQGGNYTVKVTATTEEQCNRSDTTFQIYVRPTPIARYETDQEFLEARELITFTDVSETFGASKDSIFWDFGYPGKFVNQEIVTVEWDTVNIYQVYHYIRTSDGCEDDTLYRIDLNTYLELPNAFSPNNDGTNDKLFLIYKSIEELFTYKIYNRWGQEIFDAEGDLDRGWDGTYNGTDQEVGVYVAHVKARGAYDTQFNFKVNVRLIR